ALTQQPFWGNVRELRNLVERSALLARHEQIGPADLVFDPAPWIEADGASNMTREQAAQRQRIVVALAKAEGNQTVAASLLGMSRRALVYKLSEYGIRRPRKTVRKPT